MTAVRDWSFAGDVMYAAWLMLQRERADDYVLASGTAHTVADLAEVAFAHVGLNPGDHIRVDPVLVRQAETTRQVGDASKARRELRWEPQVGFEELIQRMVDADLRTLECQIPLP